MLEEGKTLQELTQESKLNRDLLWAHPFNELQFWTRVWFYAMKQQQGLRRFEQSPVLKAIYSKMKNIIDDSGLLASALRAEAEARIESIVKELPEWREWASHVPGVGAFSFGKLLGLIGNPAARNVFSSLARHCGVAVINGQIEKPAKGQRRPYNAQAKAQLFLIVSSVLKAYPRVPNLYGEFYYLSRQKFERKHPDWSDMHCHLASLLRTARLFLSHLWEVSRKAQGLPTREPYPIEYGGHVVKIPYTMALHPFKRLPEVVEAIEKVMPLLREEPAAEVVEETEELIKRLSQKIVTYMTMGKKKRRKKE